MSHLTPPVVPQPILLADIGATNARFALASAEGRLTLEPLATAAHPSLESALAAFLERTGAAPPAMAALAVAGAVQSDRVNLINCGWSFSIAAVRERFGFRRLLVVNDFTAAAMGVPQLGPGDSRAVGGGQARPGGVIGVLGPGSGLGVSGLIPQGDGWLPLAGEGGHTTLPARSEREAVVIAQVRQQLGHVSAERLVSGPGLVQLYRAVSELAGETPASLTPADVTARALTAACPRCQEALELFCGFLGSVAGNLALTLGASGGIYLAGGILPRLGEAVARSPFRASFEDKGRLAPWLATVPTRIITHPHLAFLGLQALIRQPQISVGVSAEG